MNVKNIICQTANLLLKDELLQSQPLGGAEQITQDNQKELDLMLFCLNQVLTAIASDYLPVVKEEQLVCLSGTFELQELGQGRVHEIKKVECDGINIGFKTVGSVVKTGKGLLTVYYAALPESATLESTILGFDPRLTERIVAFGIATEYFFITGEFTQAAVWENRYKAALESACRKKSEITIPPRRWL